CGHVELVQRVVELVTRGQTPGTVIGGEAAEKLAAKIAVGQLRVMSQRARADGRRRAELAERVAAARVGVEAEESVPRIRTVRPRIAALVPAAASIESNARRAAGPPGIARDGHGVVVRVLHTAADARKFACVAVGVQAVDGGAPAPPLMR